jgi:hypothetical protein
MILSIKYINISDQSPEHHPDQQHRLAVVHCILHRSLDFGQFGYHASKIHVDRSLQSFMEATYDRVGASPQIARAYKWALAFSMTLNGGFFLIAALALWISKIAPLHLREILPCSMFYLVFACVALALVPVWMLIVR